MERRRRARKARLGSSQFGVSGRTISGGGLLSQSACSFHSQDLLPYPAYLQDQFVPLADLKLAFTSGNSVWPIASSRENIESILYQLKICVACVEWLRKEKLESNKTGDMSFAHMVENAAAGNEWTQQQMSETKAPEGRGLWSPEEHQLFVHGIKMFPSGPWKDIASHVGTRTARQTMTHAQKYRQKIARRLRNVRMSGKHNLPFLMDQSSRFNALLSNDEQFNDSILATSLAIAAEHDLDLLGETGMDDNTSPMQRQMGMSTQANLVMELMGTNTYQKQLPLAIDFSATEGSPYYLDDPSFEPSDIEFDKCIDFLIETFHRET